MLAHLKSKRKTKKERDKKRQRQNQRKGQRQGQIKGQKYQKINSLVKSAQICRRWKSWGQSHFKVSLLRKLLVISFKVWSHIVPLMASTYFLSLGLINFECIFEQTNVMRACYEAQTHYRDVLQKIDVSGLRNQTTRDLLHCSLKNRK